ncbi:NAD synthetase [Pseudomonas sp. AFG_SD02_1510_Pfu_092]|uniref:NAD synthetase n=1 Tax=Pseudomonas sp. AFG_SD02_1510_Pfu_092 TaxID=2259497 RepID=UPI000DEF51C8|nr:NAD synthetase [Pseudomonas sp. AFG_SD02_1510_Pfu_092]RCL24158.1 NAD synthetase [Pseudomonas sp. AFG_SD02_1510_Pfu_092]
MTGVLGGYRQQMARQRLLLTLDQQKLFRAIDADPGIVGAGVVYIDAQYNVIVLREFKPICSIAPKRIILQEAPPYTSPEQFMTQLQTGARERKVVSEAMNATATCLSAALGWIVMFSGTVAVPFTGGASLALTAVGYAAAAAGTGQCMMGAYRVYNEMNDPEQNDWLDSNDTVQTVMSILDGVALLGVGASGANTVRFLQVRKAATGKSWSELFHNLSRQQRKALAKELLLIRHPSLTARQLKLQQAAGTAIKRFTPTQIQHATRTLIQDSIGALSGFGSSSFVQSVAVGLYEEISE